MLVPCGGLLASNLRAGKPLLVSGATSNFGGECVAVAPATGVRCVVAPGRKECVLADLEMRIGERIRTVKLTGNEDDDRERMRAAAGAPIDCVMDLLPPSR